MPEFLPLYTLADQPAILAVPELGGLECLQAGTGREPLAAHFHEEWVIGVNTTGEQHFDHRGSRHVSGPGWLTTINPEDVHACYGGAQQWHYVSYHLSPVFVRTLADEIGAASLPRFAGSTVEDAGMARRLLGLFLVLAGSDCPLQRETGLLETFAELAQRHMQGRAVAPLLHTSLARARDRLADALDDEITLQLLADDCGLSRWQFCRLFREQYGLAPLQWRKQLRVMRSRQLLRRGLAPGEVAVQLGFADQPHFTRAFKGAFGVTPARYQRGFAG